MKLLTSIRFSALCGIFSLVLLSLLSCKKEDKTAPGLTLTGGDVIFLDLGQPWSDPGYAATDDEDGDLTGDVQVSGTVDTVAVGHYVITYTVSDAAGNQASTRRDVYVRARLLAGEYHVDAQVTGANAGTYAYFVSVLEDTSYNVLYLKNMCDFGSQVVMKILVQQHGILLSSQSLQGVPQHYEGTISGTGSYDGENQRITALDYLISYLNGANDQGTTTFTRQ